MSERLQFEYHPDADQIGAFVEQALPAHEREQMLDHLAVCAECRSIVALSLPEIEEPARPIPVLARRPWWAGWAIAWPVAGAVAALALVFFYVHRGPLAPNAPPQQQVAESHVPEAPSSSPPVAAPSAKPALQASAAQKDDKSLAASTRDAKVAAKRSGETANAAQAVGRTVLTGRDAAELIKLAPQPPQAGIALKDNRPSAAFANSANNNANDVVAGVSTGASANDEGKLQPTAPTDSAAMAPRFAAAAPGTTVPPAINNNTVTVVANEVAPMQTISVDAASAELALEPVQTEAAVLKHPLPSRLPVLSIAAQGRYMVAIDTRSAVFMSNDSGKHWKAIHAKWQGRAIKAALVELPTGSETNLSLNTTAAMGAYQDKEKALAGTMRAALAAPAAAPSASGLSISGTVTDRIGAAIPGASVIVTELATGTAHMLKTDGTGRYVVDGLVPGTYSVTAQANGFRKQSLAAVAVVRPTVADLSLTVAASTQTVMVTGANVIEATDANKKAAKPAASKLPGPIFEITTDNGERWTSTDGVTWKRM
jgi:hypothetical protein